MLTCKDFAAWLNEYLDKSATEEIRISVEEHITCCPNCHVIFDTTKKTLAVFKGANEEPLPKSVHDRLMAAIEKRIARGS